MALTLDMLARSVEASCSVRATRLVFKTAIAAENVLLISVAIVGECERFAWEIYYSYKSSEANSDSALQSCSRQEDTILPKNTLLLEGD